MTKRQQIVNKMSELLKEISPENGFKTNIYSNVKTRFLFPDDDPELPILCVTAGPERIEYQPGNFQDRYLSVYIRGYLESQDNPGDKIEQMIQDIERVFTDNSNFVLEDGTAIRDIRIVTIETDQGVLAPLGTTEIQTIVEY